MAAASTLCQNDSQNRRAFAAYNRPVTSRSAIRATVLVLIVLALTVFAGEAVHELHYASDHPGAYGPARVIALACAAGAVLSLAAAIALLALTPSGEAVRRTVLVLLIATAIALGIWLVALSAASSGSTGGNSGFWRQQQLLRHEPSLNPTFTPVLARSMDRPTHHLALVVRATTYSRRRQSMFARPKRGSGDSVAAVVQAA